MNLKFKELLTKRRFNTRLILIPIAILLAIILYRFKGLVVVATVNGEPMSRIEVLRQLEKEGGKNVLDTMITNALILQEGKKQKIAATQDEINTQISQIEENLKAAGQTLDSALEVRGMTRKDLDDQIKLQVLVQKMAGKDIKVEDKEIEDYFNQNKASYPAGQKLDETLKDQIKKDLESQKLNTSIQDWITNLKTNAKINYFVQY